jgi:uncharacterized membrane protein YdjX (TVP38/TMEM64 family)
MSRPRAEAHRDALSAAARVATLAVVVAVAGAALLREPAGTWLVHAVETARRAGPTGWFLYGLAYVAGALLLLPALPITIGAGWAFGPVVGACVAVPASCLGACVAFTAGRTAARRFGLEPRGARWTALAEAVRSGGFRAVLLLRLSPAVPFAALNYALGLSPLRLRAFAGASLLGMLPGTIAYAWLGSLLPGSRHVLEGGMPAGAAGAAVLAGIAALTVVVVIAAGRALGRSDERAPARELRATSAGRGRTGASSRDEPAV